jgi:hypothetical protein
MAKKRMVHLVWPARGGLPNPLILEDGYRVAKAAKPKTGLKSRFFTVLYVESPQKAGFFENAHGQEARESHMHRQFSRQRLIE